MSETLKRHRRWLVIAAFVSLTLAEDARAGCSCAVTLKNGFDNVPVTISKIKAAFPFPPNPLGTYVYKEQWTGQVTIAAGANHRFTFTLDAKCDLPRFFKFYKADGKTCVKDLVFCGQTVTCAQGGWN